MAKLCYENGLTKGADIVSYIRLSMECLWQYINNYSQARGESSAGKGENQQQPQKKQEGGIEPQDLNHHAMTTTTTTSSTAAAAESTTSNAVAETENSGESIITRSPPSSPVFNIWEYFQPVFDQVDELNKRLDSIGEEENDRWKERKRNEQHRCDA
jgi:hypothetical protein